MGMREAPHKAGGIETEDQGTPVDPGDRGKNIWGTEGPATDFFAADSYREYQRETIEEIEDAFEQGYRYVLLNAPTGSGKSQIARAFAFQSGSAHILTVQKILQDQYQQDFPDMYVMKGRSAYQCEKELGETCSSGICRRRRIKNPNCPYTLAKKAAQIAPVTVHNFDSFYYRICMAGLEVGTC